MYTQTHTHTDTDTYIYIHIHTYIHTYTYTHTHTYTYTDTHTYIYIHILIYIYTQRSWRLPRPSNQSDASTPSFSMETSGQRGGKHTWCYRVGTPLDRDSQAFSQLKSGSFMGLPSFQEGILDCLRFQIKPRASCVVQVHALGICELRLFRVSSLCTKNVTLDFKAAKSWRRSEH